MSARSGDEAGSRAGRRRQSDFPATFDRSNESISTIGVKSRYFTKIHQAVSAFWSWRHLPEWRTSPGRVGVNGLCRAVHIDANFCNSLMRSGPNAITIYVF